MTSRYQHSRTTDQGRHSYAPSLFSGAHLNESHRRIAELVDEVPGKLQEADHLKLYEMAYLANGPILEIGRDAGRSLAVMAWAVRESGSGVPVYSIEVDDRKLPKAERNLRSLGLLDVVTLIQGDSAGESVALGTVFDLVFLDGDHTYDGVARDLEALQGRIAPGGSLMAHDYFDPRNEAGDPDGYGVRGALNDAAPAMGLEFRGGYGAIALFEQT